MTQTRVTKQKFQAATVFVAVFVAVNGNHLDFWLTLDLLNRFKGLIICSLIFRLTLSTNNR